MYIYLPPQTIQNLGYKETERYSTIGLVGKLLYPASYYNPSLASIVKEQ